MGETNGHSHYRDPRTRSIMDEPVSNGSMFDAARRRNPEINFDDLDRMIDDEHALLEPLPNGAGLEEISGHVGQMLTPVLMADIEGRERVLRHDMEAKIKTGLTDINGIVSKLRIRSLELLAEHEARLRRREDEQETKLNARLTGIEAMIERRIATLKAEPGPVGPPGKDGVLPIAKVWSPGMIAYAGDLVVHGSSSWQALEDTATTPEEGSTVWRLIAAAGRDAKPWRMRGTWRGDAAYETGDVVVSDSASFLALTADPGPCPGAGWQMLVAPRRGPRGEKGDTGSRGPVGPPGSTAPVQTAWKVDAEAFVVWPVYSDNTIGPQLDLRDLFVEYQRQTG
jgi:hypothetical protein